jgi:hypothetical protein
LKKTFKIHKKASSFKSSSNFSDKASLSVAFSSQNRGPNGTGSLGQEPPPSSQAQMASLKKQFSVINETEEDSRDSWSQPVIIEEEEEHNSSDRGRPRTLETKSTFEHLETMSDADFENEDARTIQE